ncbi:hypothetical protein GE061_016320 [Apolygus lucorum]|uniref:Carbonic anhydrase n=1 Tax=Apolygus lucorum TaxID=248454 RepID=A0A8S9XHW5_APOLU|nr:hypothetical protein GE061_016320 [Apolygus lucorum]
MAQNYVVTRSASVGLLSSSPSEYTRVFLFVGVAGIRYLGGHSFQHPCDKISPRSPAVVLSPAQQPIVTPKIPSNRKLFNSTSSDKVEMSKMMKVLLAVVLFVVPYVAAHIETSDLEESVHLKLDKLLFFKRKPGKNTVRTGSKDALYSYDGGPGTSNWDGVCSSGTKQSPIDFKPEETVAVYRRVLRFHGATQIPQNTNITNSGHSIKIKLRTQKPITVTGGVFGSKVYEFQQLHFHWGKNVNEGSEHTIKTKQYPLEGHLVFYKVGSKDPTTEPDGIAVLGVQYEFFRKDNIILEPIIKSIGQVTNPGQFVVKSNGFPLRDYLPADLDTYLSYTGSLTTPPCTEGVTWIVFSDKQSVSERQVSQFRTMKDDIGLKVEYNFRETHPLNGRQVHLVKSSERVVA